MKYSVWCFCTNVFLTKAMHFLHSAYSDRETVRSLYNNSTRFGYYVSEKLLYYTGFQCRIHIIGRILDVCVLSKLFWRVTVGFMSIFILHVDFMHNYYN